MRFDGPDPAGVEELPPEIGRLSETLTILAVTLASSLKLPKELSELSKLALLDLGSNGIAELPSEYGALTSLVTLKLEGNRLHSVPSELGALTELRWLYLSENKLAERSLPESFARLTLLRHLVLANNQLTTVPELSVHPQSYPALTFLNLAANDISRWPKGWVVKDEEQFAEDSLGNPEMYNNHLAKMNSRQSSPECSLLVLASGNPVVNRTAGGDYLFEIDRSTDDRQLPLILASSRPNCAPSCQSSFWKPGNVRANSEGELLGYCFEECDVATCDARKACE